MNVTRHTLRWLKNYLTGRSIRTRVDDQLYKEREILKGVHKEVMSECFFSTWLWPTFLFQTIDANSRYSRTMLQSISLPKRKKLLTNQIEEWAIGWNLEFSVEKCVSICFTKKRKSDPAHQFQVSCLAISEVSDLNSSECSLTLNYRGIPISKPLSTISAADRILSSCLPMAKTH